MPCSRDVKWVCKERDGLNVEKLAALVEHRGEIHRAGGRGGLGFSDRGKGEWRRAGETSRSDLGPRGARNPQQNIYEAQRTQGLID
jgi:hypothetical protein